MTYKELKREIVKASKIRKDEGIISYFDEMGNNMDCQPSFNQICRAYDEGLLERDLNTYIVK